MTVPSGGRCYEVVRGADFRFPFRVKPRGALIDTSSATILFELDNGTTYTTADKLAALLADSQISTAITGAFTATGAIIASGAAFATNRVSLTDVVTLAGTISNDSTTLALASIDSDAQVTVTTTLTAEAAQGTVTVSRGPEWYELHLEEADTLAFAVGLIEFKVKFTLGDTFYPLIGALNFVDTPTVTTT